MTLPSNKDNLAELIPKISDSAKRDIVAYFLVFEKHEEALAEMATEELKDHPVFGPVISSIPPDVAAANRVLTRKLQRDAIMDGNWLPYIEYNIEQGIVYAKMGLAFQSWYEVVALAKKYLIPFLREEYGNGEKFQSALNGMNSMMDIAMCVIGEAYMQEKKQQIEEEQEKINKLNQELELKVAERTKELEAMNKELEAFSYSVSHDLRAPLRAINGFARILNEEYAPKMDAEALHHLNAILRNSRKMGILIDDLLEFSRLGRMKIIPTGINMDSLVKSVIEEEIAENSNKIEIITHPLLPANGGQTLLKQVWVNLISNAVKYAKDPSAVHIEIGSYPKDDSVVYYVKDNGVGFDMQYYDKLFGVFQRLHSQEEFEGTGIGLAIVKRIINHHNGQVWAESTLNAGSCFYFSLPITNN